MPSLKEAKSWLRRLARGQAPAAPSSSFEQWAGARNPLQGRVYADFSEFERATVKQAPDTVASTEAMVALLRAVEHVVRHRVPGAFIECGVYAGGNIELMIRALQHFEISDRDIYAYDTFAGMPRPAAVDRQGPDGDLTKIWEANRTKEDGDNGSTWMRASLEAVQQRIRRLGYPDERLHFVKGMVEETIPAIAPERIAVLRLDTDYYSSTRHELEHFYPRLSPGGALIIDDYGAMDGCRIATDEYAEHHATRWFLHRVDAHVRMAIKP